MKNIILSILLISGSVFAVPTALAAPTPGPYQAVTLALGKSLIVATADNNNSFTITFTGSSTPPICSTCSDLMSALFTIKTKAGDETTTSINVGQSYTGFSLRISVIKMDSPNEVTINAEIYRPENAHPLGTNILAPDGTVYTMTTEQMRRPYSSPAAFLSYGFNNFASLVPANAADMTIAPGPITAPQDGRIVCSDRGNDRGTCYVMTNGHKAGFVSEAVFHAQGYSFARALYGDVSFMPTDINIENASDAHRQGTLVNNNGTIQMIYSVGTGSNLLGIPSMAVFNGWGFNTADVVVANAADKRFAQSSVLFARRPGDLHINLTGWQNMTE